MNKASDDNGKIIFDGIALDARFKGLLDYLAQKGITTREAIRNTALTSFVSSRPYASVYEEVTFQRDLRDLRILTAEPTTQPAEKTAWADAIGKKIPVSSLFPGRAVITSLSQAGIETLYDLFRHPEKTFKQSPANAEECYEAFQTLNSLTILSLGLIKTGANILLRNGITSIGQLILTGDEYLSLLPGMQPNLMNDIRYALKNLRGVLGHYRKISGWAPQIPVKPDTPDQPQGTPPVKKTAAPSEANYRAFLSEQGNPYAEDYVKTLRLLESPEANIGFGKRRLFSESVPESREALDYLRKSLPGTKWNTDKARSILNNFDEFLKTLSEERPIPAAPVTDNEIKKTVRTALEELYKAHPNGVTASEISHKINDWKNLPPATISEILDHATWARKEWDPEIDNYRYTITISEKTSGPEPMPAPDPDLAELVRNMLIKCSGKSHRYNTAAYIATSISDKTSVSRVKNILQNAEWAHENEYGLFTYISPEMIEAVRQTLRKQAIERPYDVFIEQFAPMVHEKLTASQIHSILMKSDWARKNPDSSFTYVPQTDEEKAAFYFEQYRTFLQIKTNEYDPVLYLKALYTLSAQLNIIFPDVLKEDLDKNYETAEYLKQNISKITLQLHQERCQTAIDAFIDFLNYRKSGSEPEPKPLPPETIEQIRRELENLCIKYPHAVFANKITQKISGVTTHSQIMAVLDKADWAKKNDDGSYTYIPPKSRPPFVMNEDTINTIKSVLQKLTEQFPLGVTLSLITGQIKGDPTQEQIRQILDDAPWAVKTDGGFYIYEDPEHSVRNTEPTFQADEKTIKEIQDVLKKLTKQFPLGVAPSSIGDRIKEPLTPEQVQQVLDEASWADETNEELYIFVEQQDTLVKPEPGFVINDATIKEIRDTLEMLTKKFPLGVSVSMIVPTVKGNPTSEQIRQVLEKAEWAKEVSSGTYLYDPQTDKPDSDPDSPAAQPNWNKYEAAILLDAYLQVCEHPEQRKFYIQQVSEQLRQMALSQGMKISDTYRNINGITMKMLVMESAWLGNEDNHFASTKLYDEITALYRSDPNEFSKILTRAKIMCRKSEEFWNWLEPKVSPAFLTELYHISLDLDAFIRKNLSSGETVYSLMLKLPYEAVRQELFALPELRKRFNEYDVNLIRKYLEFLRDYLYQGVTKPDSPDPVRTVDFSNPADLRKTVPLSLQFFKDRILDPKDWETLYVMFLSLFFAVYPGFLRHGMILSDKSRSLDICDINYALMIKKRRHIPKTYLFARIGLDPNEYIAKIRYLLDQKRILYRNLIITYKNSDIQTDPPDISPITDISDQATILIDRIEKLLLEKEALGMTINDLQMNLQIKQYEIQDAIGKSENIIELKSKFYHKDAFIDIDEAADQLESILDKLMTPNDNATTAGLLYKYAHSEMAMFLNDNDLDDQKSVYDLAKHFFMKCHYHGKSYRFTDNTYITNSEEKIEKLLDVVIHFGKSLKRPFTQEELIRYLEKLELPTSNLHGKMQIGVKPFIFIYNTKEYLIAESLNIDEAFITRAKEALTRLLEDSGEYATLRNITENWYYQMPQLPYNIVWTPLLLQQILRFFGKKIGFRTVPAMDGQSYDTLHAVIVANGSWIKNFRDAAAIFLYENYPEQKTFEAEELRQVFVKSGMIKGNELIWNMPKALGKDERFIWDSDGSHVRIRLSE